MKYILFVLTILFLVSNASATQWSITNPTGIGYTSATGFNFVITEHTASTGSVYNWFADPTNPSSSTRISKCNLCIYAAMNPADNTLWATDDAGNLFYVSQFGQVDYSLGFYTLGASGCTNCNPLYKVASLTALDALHITRKIAFDSSGNVYVFDNGAIKKYVKALGYSEQSFYTLVAGVDWNGLATYNVLDIAVDSQNNIRLLIGDYCAGCAAGLTRHLDYDVITSAGVHDYSIFSLATVGSGAGGFNTGFFTGGLILDDIASTDADYKDAFTYMYASTSAHATPGVGSIFLKHNSLSGTTDIGGGALVGFTTGTDIGYNNFQIYVSSDAQDIIKTFVTTFAGSVPGSIPTNPDGITGTLSWLNGYGSSVTTISPGMALAYRWTISTTNTNYTYFSGWGMDTITEPSKLRDLTDLTGLGVPAVFPTSSNEIAGNTIYGYLLSRRNNDSSWYVLTAPVSLVVSASENGYDSITLDRTYYNLTGDTIKASFSYGSGFPYIYKWQLCARVDCSDSNIFNTVSLAAFQSNSSMVTDGLKSGNYYAVMMKHLPFLINEIVAYQRFEIRPPVVGVAFDKPEYNLLPKSAINVCSDSTPTTSYFSNITGYAGLQRGWFSCPTVPQEASQNNSVMRMSIYAKYNGTFYLNNSFGNIWNGTVKNGSAAVIYVLTNSSPTETWTLEGVNVSTLNTGNESFKAMAEVKPESILGYSIGVSPTIAYNGETVYFTFTKPVYKLIDVVNIRDAGGQLLASFNPTDTSGSYYIDPSKKYTYGTWTAYWKFGSQNPLFDTGTTATFVVKNAARKNVNGSITPYTPASDLSALMENTTFWALVFIVVIMLAIARKERKI